MINSCTNLEELGITGVFAAYNAKPVLIRRTGSIFRGPNYMEVDIHVHKVSSMYVGIYVWMYILYHITPSDPFRITED